MFASCIIEALLLVAYTFRKYYDFWMYSTVFHYEMPHLILIILFILKSTLYNINITFWPIAKCLHCI